MGNQLENVNVITWMAEASQRMHASSDVSLIMREAVVLCLKLVTAKQGAAGLLIDDELAFSEYSDAKSWYPMLCRFNQSQSLATLIKEQKVSIGATKSSFYPDLGHALTTVDSILAVPVMGSQGLLACLVLMNAEAGEFSQQNVMSVEQVAVMMASAIESGLKHVENKRVEADLQKSVATYRTLVEQIPAMTYIASMDRNKLLFVSPQVEAMLGYSQADFLANQEIWMERVHPDDRARVLGEVGQSIQDECPFHSEYKIRTKNNKTIWVKDAADVVRDQDEDLYLQGVLYDISERKETEQKMLHLAHFDHLTGLANRALFLDRLKQAVAQSKRNKQPFAVMFLDLDGFKAINDSLGHQAGDVLLAEAANRLRSHVREADTVARMGGDEFTIILSDIQSKSDIRIVAEKLIASISETYPHIQHTQAVTMSMGIAMYPKDSQQSDELVTLADDAMYKAKKAGKNRLCFVGDAA
ncbi:MAG: sensor domain-containing diguanylate cyclase [Ghiorsea sp.]